MSLDSGFVLSFVAIFVRCGAMLLSSPLYGGATPVNIRILASVVISLALTPVVGPLLDLNVTNIVELGMLMGREAIFGLLIGMCLQFLMASLQIAGSFMDMQLGLGSAQLFNPQMGGQTSPLGQFKFWLGMVIMLLLNAHQMMFRAFVASFNLKGAPMGGGSIDLISAGYTLLGNLLVLSLQIAAPVVAVTVIIDIAAGLINRAVPQTQPFLLATPAKLALGLLTLSIGLPALVVEVQRVVEVTFFVIEKMFGG